MNGHLCTDQKAAQCCPPGSSFWIQSVLAALTKMQLHLRLTPSQLHPSLLAAPTCLPGQLPPKELHPSHPSGGLPRAPGSTAPPQGLPGALHRPCPALPLPFKASKMVPTQMPAGHRKTKWKAGWEAESLGTGCPILFQHLLWDSGFAPGPPPNLHARPPPSPPTPHSRCQIPGPRRKQLKTRRLCVLLCLLLVCTQSHCSEGALIFFFQLILTITL